MHTLNMFQPTIDYPLISTTPLLYTKGWPTVMPSADEAEVLCEVRLLVAAAVGLEIDYTTPERLLGRYAELMAARPKGEL